MNRAYLRLAFVSALVLIAALAPRDATASTVLTGGNLVNQTWTPAGSPYVIEGDVTVPAGSTLSIQGGTNVQFVNGDMQASGLDATRAEMTINGSLNIAGTTANPVTFEMQQGQTGTWYGLVIGAGATAATITGASFAGYSGYAITDSMAGATLSVTRTAIRGSGNNGIHVSGGPATLDALTIMPATGAPTLSIALELDGGPPLMPQVNVTNVLIVDANVGVDIAGNLTVNASSLTIDHPEWGIYVNGSVAAVAIANTIITNASTDGIIATASGTTSVSYSDIWNCSTSTSNCTTGAGMLSANPQYVASGSEYYRLQPSSVCIDSGTSTGAPDHDLDGAPRPLDGDGINGAQYDMGAYEYNAGGGIGGAGGGPAGMGGAAGAAGAAATGGAGGAAGAAGTSGAGGAAGAAGSAGAGAAGSGGSAGVSGAASGGSGGGAAGVGGATGTAGAAGAAGASGGSGGGCGCQTGGRPGSAWALVQVGAALILRRRRRAGRT